MLCPGGIRREGWQTVDADPRSKAGVGYPASTSPDFVACIPPLPDSVRAFQWQDIEWIHGITSLYPWQAAEVLKEIREILAPGGAFVLEQPDISKCYGNMRWIFGDPSPKDSLYMNHWGYTPESLSAILMEAGFNHIEVLEAKHHFPERDFRIQCSR
jgi:hypothetical protein